MTPTEMTREQLIARVIELEQRLRRAHHRVYAQRRRAVLWRHRALSQPRKLRMITEPAVGSPPARAPGANRAEDARKPSPSEN